MYIRKFPWGNIIQQRNNVDKMNPERIAKWNRTQKSRSITSRWHPKILKKQKQQDKIIEKEKKNT